MLVDVLLGSAAHFTFLWLVLLGPPLVALALAGRLGGRAIQVALGGLLVELLIVVAFLAALSGANWS